MDRTHRDAIALGANNFQFAVPAITELAQKSALQVPAERVPDDGKTHPPSAHTCRVETYHTFEAAAAIRKEWGQLAEAVGADLFGSFEWCEIWWKHFSVGRRLEIYAIWSGDELVAVFPLFRETLRWGPVWLRVVRVVGSDHAGTRCWPLLQNVFAQGAVQHLMAALSGQGPWDIFQIGDLAGYYQQSQLLCSALRDTQAGNLHVNQDYYPHAVFTIPENFELYLDRLSGNERNNIRKNERRLSRTHQLKRTVVSPADRLASLHEFFRWHDDYWDTQSELGFFSLWPGSREFHSDIAQLKCEAGEAVFIRVDANEDPIGLVCAHRFLGRLHLFQAVRAPGGHWEAYGPGRILHCETFRWCIANGISTVDAMSGFYEYKRRLGADFLALTTLALVNRSLSSRVRTQLFRAVVYLVDAMYFRMWICRIAPLLRRRFRMENVPFLRAGMARRFIRSRFILAAMSSVKDESILQAPAAGHPDA